MIGYFTDFRMLEHLPYDLRQNTYLFNHLRQFPVNIAPLERASGLANRYLYSLEINFNSNLLTNSPSHLLAPLYPGPASGSFPTSAVWLSSPPRLSAA